MTDITIELVKKVQEDKVFISLKNHLVDFFNSYYNKVLKEPMRAGWGSDGKKRFTSFLKELKAIEIPGETLHLKIYPGLELSLEFKRVYDSKSRVKQLKNSFLYSIKFGLDYKSQKEVHVMQQGIHKYLNKDQYIKPINVSWKEFVKQNSYEFNYTLVTPN